MVNRGGLFKPEREGNPVVFYMQAFCYIIYDSHYQ